jgi:3-oxoacyl-(acyl-carrier-protein) synthase III
MNYIKSIGISAISTWFPEKILTSREVEEKVSTDSNQIIPKGIIKRTTGVETRHCSGDDEYNSTLAINACNKLFTENNIDPLSIDLLIFAATGQDLIEPATSHIIQREIGTQCPVMDVTNACNSFINSLEIAHALISSGRYNSVLIATGEVPTKATRFLIDSCKDMKNTFLGYLLGDAGTSVLVEQNPKILEINNFSFFSDSSDWDVAMFRGGGSRFLNDKEAYFFEGDGKKLVRLFFKHTKRLFNQFLFENNISVNDIDHFYVHQVTGPYFEKMCKELKIPLGKVQRTIEKYGNVAAASLPLGMNLRHNSETPTLSGQKAILIGLAGGMSVGFALMSYK